MKMVQRKTMWLSRLMLVAVLFAQGILAAHACVAPTASAAQALSMESGNEMSCHESKKLTANECLMHCTQGDQVNLDQQPIASVAVNEVVLQVASPAVQRIILISEYSPLALNTGPPLSIRFCSFLI